MRKFKGLLCSVSMAAVLLFSGISVCAEETESVTEAAVEAAAAPAEFTEDGILASDAQALESFAQASIEMIVGMTEEQIEEQMHPTSLLVIPDKTMIASLESWNSAKEELGAYIGVAEHHINVTKDVITVTSYCEFENMAGVVNTTLNRDDLSMESMTFSTGDVSMGQKMAEAGMNTIMGIGIVFLVLLFLSILIAQFKHVSKLENSFKKKPAEAPKAAPAPAASAAAPVEEEAEDDGELIAVIAAAIAAAEGTSPDGFVVRSIKKHNRNKWQRA